MRYELIEIIKTAKHKSDNIGFALSHVLIRNLSEYSTLVNVPINLPVLVLRGDQSLITLKQV
jgi:hypothetical protein